MERDAVGILQDESQEFKGNEIDLDEQRDGGSGGTGKRKLTNEEKLISNKDDE